MKHRKILGKIACLAVIMLGTTAFAQTKEQIEKMKKETDTTALEMLKKKFQNEKMSEEQLKEKAKKMNVEYRYTLNGVTYQLVDFDSNGFPLYYQTFENKTKETPKKKCCLPTSRLEKIKKKTKKNKK